MASCIAVAGRESCSEQGGCPAPGRLQASTPSEYVGYQIHLLCLSCNLQGCPQHPLGSLGCLSAGQKQQAVYWESLSKEYWQDMIIAWPSAGILFSAGYIILNISCVLCCWCGSVIIMCWLFQSSGPLCWLMLL